MMEPILVPLILMAGAFLILAIDILFKKGAPSELLEYASYLTVLGALVPIVLRVWNQAPDLTGFHNAVALDGLATFNTISILVATGLALLFAANLSARFDVAMPEYLALLLLSASGMIFLSMATDLVTLFLSLEIMSLALYVLTGVTRNEARSGEAAIKYFIMGSVASAFLAYGMVLLYGVTGSIQLEAIGAKLSGGVAFLGLGMLLIGFAFKVGAAPFHMWVPDVYEGAPTAVTSFMSVAVKAAAFTALIRAVWQLAPGMGERAGQLLEVVAILTMIVGNVFALAQPSVKRMLAYSSIAHSGYALIGIVVAAEGTFRNDGAQAASFYLLAYTFMTLGAFATLIFVGTRERDAESLDNFQCLATRHPFAALAMSIFMLSLAGMPPLGGFFGKFMLFRVALNAGHPWLVVVAVLTTLLSAYYYIRVIVYMYMKPAPEAAKAPMADWSVGAAIVVSAAFTLVLGLIPRFIDLAQILIKRATAF